MIISKLELKNFRNYQDLTISPAPGLNVFYGENGQGKTNIIEAIYMCACARSHRTSKDLELIKHDESYYQIDLNYYSSYADSIDYNFEHHLGLIYGKNIPGFPSNNRNQRVLFKDNVHIDKVSEFIGNFHAVIFAPEDLELVKDGPAVRRRFLDLLLSQVKYSYFINLQDYFRILNQRNKLLKQFKDADRYILNEFEAAQLDVWDEELAKAAVNVVVERLQLVELIKDYANKIHTYITTGTEHLNFKYKTNTGIKLGMSIEEMFGNMVQRLKDKRTRDIVLGSTSIGPHRDDFDIILNDFLIRNYGSQGQQRTAVLALKMAELQIMEDLTKEVPVLLLDDVMSELDSIRRDKLLSSLNNTQIFITTTDPEQLDKNWLEKSSQKDISYYKVNAAEVSKMSPV